jgi:hypothetical protein
MGNVSVKSHKHQHSKHSGHKHQHSKRSGHKHSRRGYNKRTRRYHGGIHPLANVVNANEDASPIDASPIDAKQSRQTKKVRNFNGPKVVVNPIIAAHVSKAKQTHADVAEAVARVSASKNPSRKRSPRKSAQVKIDMMKMAQSREQARLDRISRENSNTPTQASIKKLSPSKEKNMRDSIKAAMAALAKTDAEFGPV